MARRDGFEEALKELLPSYNLLVDFDAVIIGGGPAGCVAAYLLAQRGHRLAIVEQHRFPREKVCGECLSDLGVETLGQVGLAAEVRAARPVVLCHTALHAPGGATAILKLPRPMWGISRAKLDSVLLTAATNAGAELIQPARCEGITGDESGVAVQVRDLSTNSLRPLRARYAIVADGKSALLPARPAPTADMGIKGHFVDANAPPDAIELFGLSGHYAGLAPIEGNRWNLAFSVPRERLRETANLDGLFERMMEQNARMKERLGDATRVGPWLASPLPRFAVRRDWPRNVVPVGNAVAAIEPIGGEGMGLAIKSAELAAKAIDHAIRTNGVVSSRELIRQFDALWRTRQMVCRGAAMLMSRPVWCDVALSLVQTVDGLDTLVMRLIGKQKLSAIA